MNKEKAKEELEKNKKYVSGCFDDEHCEESFNEGIDVAIKIIEKVESSQQKKSVKKIVSEVNKLRTYTIEEECFEVDLILKSAVLKLLDQLDQPKLVVPKFVAEWYEEHKDNFYLNLHRLAWELIENLDEDDFVPKKALDSDFKRWYHKTETAIQTLINMHQFGYTVEKEKLYTVEIPNPNEGQLSFVLMRQPDGNVRIKVMHSSNLGLLKTDNDLQLTEQEIRKDFDWAWQWKKEVTE